MQNGLKKIKPILTLAAVIVLVVAGYMIFTKSVGDKSNNNNSASESSEGNVRPDEDSKILAAAGCESGSADCVLIRKQENLAMITDSREPSEVTVIVAKENDEWKVVHKGSGDIPAEVKEKYSVPSAWTEQNTP